MRIDRNSGERTPDDSEEFSNLSTNLNFRTFVQRHLFTEIPLNRSSVRPIRSQLSRFTELEEEPLSPEDTMEWSPSWTGEDRRGYPGLTPEDLLSSPHNIRVLPAPSEVSSELHPFLLHQPSSDSIFPCPEQGTEEEERRPGQIRRRYLEEGGLLPGRSTSRRRSNRWPAAISDPDYEIPSFASFLVPFQKFKGFQRCTRREGNELVPSSGAPSEEWSAEVLIKEYIASRGYLCGTMKAFVKPGCPVVTFWQGEIIDNKNFTFKTEKWTASSRTDMEHWRRFLAFRNLRRPLLSDCWKVPGLREYPYIFMRWKELFFVTKPEENTLTIQGFYYICLCRATGEIDGYYYDPRNNSYQELQLTPDRQGHPGISFACYEFR